MRLVEETIERQIRPELQKDGGDIQLVDLEGNRVMVSLRGVCKGCPSSGITIKGIEQRLKDMVSQDLVVEEVAS